MGIYDRDYYRKEGPSYIGSFMDHGKVCKWLIIVNIGCFLLQNIATQLPSQFPRSDEEVRQRDQPFTDAMRLDAPAVLHGQLWRPVTHAFMHNGIMHLVFNMLFLWWFGTDVEDLYGPVEFLTFYLTAAVAGGLAFVFAWQAGWGNSPYALGASGAIMAVVVVCAMHYPSRIIYIWFIPMPIWFFVLFAVAKDWAEFASHANSGTAVSGHLGGAAFGFIYYKLNWRISGMFSGFKTMQRPRTRSRLRLYREEEEPVVVNPSSGHDSNELLEAKLDAILEKVARSGQASLSESERQILLRASEVYKRKKT